MTSESLKSILEKVTLVIETDGHPGHAGTSSYFAERRDQHSNLPAVEPCSPPSSMTRKSKFLGSAVTKESIPTTPAGSIKSISDSLPSLVSILSSQDVRKPQKHREEEPTVDVRVQEGNSSERIQAIDMIIPHIKVKTVKENSGSSDVAGIGGRVLSSLVSSSSSSYTKNKKEDKTHNFRWSADGSQPTSKNIFAPTLRGNVSRSRSMDVQSRWGSSHHALLPPERRRPQIQRRKSNDSAPIMPTQRHDSFSSGILLPSKRQD